MLDKEDIRGMSSEQIQEMLAEWESKNKCFTMSTPIDYMERWKPFRQEALHE